MYSFSKHFKSGTTIISLIIASLITLLISASFVPLFIMFANWGINEAFDVLLINSQISFHFYLTLMFVGAAFTFIKFILGAITLIPLVYSKFLIFSILSFVVLIASPFILFFLIKFIFLMMNVSVYNFLVFVILTIVYNLSLNSSKKFKS